MKKHISFILIFTLAIILISSFAITAFAVEDPSKAEKDGLKAELTLTPDETAKGFIRMTVTLTNKKSEFASNIKVTPTLPDGIVLAEGSADSVKIAVGETHSFEFLLANESLTEAVATDPVTEAPEGGCGAVIGSASVILVIAITFAAIILSKGKKAMSSLALLLVCGGLISIFAIPTGAAVSERSFTLSGTVSDSEGEYTVTVTISYTYDFKETKSEGTEGMDNFEISYFYGPSGDYICNEEIVKAIADAGFTSIPVNAGSVEKNKQALALLKKYGMTCSDLVDSRVMAVIGPDRTASPNISQEEVDKVIEAVVADYKDCDNIVGWNLYDEPCAAMFDILGKVVSAFKKYDPDRETCINLFPNYANATQLGVSPYSKYLELFIEEVDPSYISYDHYHFLNSGLPRSGFYENIEIVRKMANKYKIDPMIIILLTEHLSYQNLTKEQLMWEANISLAYGMKRISYFTYWLDQPLLDQGWSNSCADYTGKIYQHYYDVQDINKWLLPLGNELFDKTSTGVYHIMSRKGQFPETGCPEYVGYGNLGEVDGLNFVIGFFDDESFMIVNKGYKADDQNTMTLIDLTSSLEYFDPASETWKDAEADGVAVRNADGKYEITFDPAEGILFRVGE